MGNKSLKTECLLVFFYMFHVYVEDWNQSHISFTLHSNEQEKAKYSRNKKNPYIQQKSIIFVLNAYLNAFNDLMISIFIICMLLVYIHLVNGNCNGSC